MTWRPWGERDVRVAAGVALLAAALLATSAWHSARIRPVVAAAPAPPSTARADDAPARTMPFDQLIALAPFSPDRRVAVLPEMLASTAATASLVPGGIRLLGTVVGDGPPFAVCRLGTARPRFLHPGDTLGGWKLQAIAPAHVTFVDDGGARHEFRLTSLGN